MPIPESTVSYGSGGRYTGYAAFVDRNVKKLPVVSCCRKPGASTYTSRMSHVATPEQATTPSPPTSTLRKGSVRPFSNVTAWRR